MAAPEGAVIIAVDISERRAIEDQTQQTQRLESLGVLAGGTVYTDWFPTSALDLMFDMESDRIRDLSFDPKMIESERGVVYSERRTSVDNNNFGALSEIAEAAAFIAHPYRWPVVGWPSDIESWTMDDLKRHFSMGYAPNNCVMVAVGDIRFDQIVELSKKYLEPIGRRDSPPRCAPRSRRSAASAASPSANLRNCRCSSCAIMCPKRDIPIGRSWT